MTDEQRWEALTVAANRELYADQAGLPVDEAALLSGAAALEAEWLTLLRNAALLPNAALLRDLALDSLSEAQATRWAVRLADYTDHNLAVPGLTVGVENAAVSLRNWKQAERELPAPQRRQVFETFLAQSAGLAPLLEARLAERRQLYAAQGTTPLEVYARREGTTPARLLALARALGEACRAPFQAMLAGLAQDVFGPGAPSVVELHALSLNRMYEPLAPLLAGRDGAAEARRVFQWLGFRLEGIALDFEDRPRKYPGAFCFPVQVPGDVRVSVRPASPHHLADMLFHELGHAAHFSGIDAARPFADRYWISSGKHETFSTLFENLLGLPDFLGEALGFGAAEAERLAAFSRFKNLLTGTWVAAAGATVCRAWLDGFGWAYVEAQFAQSAEAFTGLSTPPALARLEPLAGGLDPYPLGYLLAMVRTAHWQDALEAEFGLRWWRRPAAGDALRAQMRLGGAVAFDDGWLEVEAFRRRWEI